MNDRPGAYAREGAFTVGILLQRLFVGCLLIGIALLSFAILVYGYLSQTRYVTVQAQVTSKHCHLATNGDGSTHTICDMRVAYTAPDGTPGSVYLPGVDPYLIHRHNGHETVPVYFESNSSETPINPQDYVPLWALILIFALVSLPLGMGGAWCVRYALARYRSEADAPGAGAIWERGLSGLYADDVGMTLRTYPSRPRKFAWSEIGRFADGGGSSEGGDNWELLIVLHDGRAEAVPCAPTPTTLMAIRDIAARHGIPTDVTGTPMQDGRPTHCGLYRDPGLDNGLRYWDGTQWSPLLQPGFIRSRTVPGASARSWSALPTASGGWTYAAAQARTMTVLSASCAAVSAALLTTGLVIGNWWGRGTHLEHEGGYWSFGLAALAALIASRGWINRRFFLELDRAANGHADGWRLGLCHALDRREFCVRGRIRLRRPPLGSGELCR